MNIVGRTYDRIQMLIEFIGLATMDVLLLDLQTEFSFSMVGFRVIRFSRETMKIYPSS